MKTVYDWVTVLMFAGLAVLLLQRSSEAQPRDKLWQYLPPALGCAIGNQLGNAGNHPLAVGILVATVIYVFYVLKPDLFNRT